MEEKNYLTYDLTDCIEEFDGAREGTRSDDELYTEILIEPLLDAVRESRILLKHPQVFEVANNNFVINLSMSVNMKSLVNSREITFFIGTCGEFHSLSYYSEDKIHNLLIRMLRKELVTKLVMFNVSKRVFSLNPYYSHRIRERFTLRPIS